MLRCCASERANEQAAFCSRALGLGVPDVGRSRKDDELELPEGLGVNVGSWDRGGAGLVLVGGGLRLHTGVMGLLGAVLVRA